MTAKAKHKFELDAELRTEQGKGASRRLRRMQDRVPAILYGGEETPAKISLDHKKVMHALENQAFYSHILTLNLSGKKQQAVLKDVQRHHYKKAIFHLDFQRVSATHPIHMKVPIHFMAEAVCPGVKAGGLVNHRMVDLEVRCLAKDLPEFIEIDLSNLELDQILHLSDVKLPKGVELVALLQGKEHDYPVVSIHLPRRSAEDEETAAAPEANKTEVMPKGKEAKEGKAPAPAAPASKPKDKSKGK